MHMLQNVVHPLDELRQVKNQADQLQAYHGKVINYNSYCNLLLSAASNYDAKYAPKGRAGTAKRNVYAHDITDYEEDDFNDAYNLDSAIVDLQANVHKQSSKDPIFARNRTLPKSHTPTFPKQHLSASNGIAFSQKLEQPGIYSQMRPRPSF